jgi:hypothetical protein
MPSVIMLNVIMPSVIMLNVIMLNVVAQIFLYRHFNFVTDVAANTKLFTAVTFTKT